MWTLNCSTKYSRHSDASALSAGLNFNSCYWFQVNGSRSAWWHHKNSGSSTYYCICCQKPIWLSSSLGVFKRKLGENCRKVRNISCFTALSTQFYFKTLYETRHFLSVGDSFCQIWTRFEFRSRNCHWGDESILDKVTTCTGETFRFWFKKAVVA